LPERVENQLDIFAVNLLRAVQFRKLARQRLVAARLAAQGSGHWLP